MNCQELSRILDEGDLSGLPANERGLAEAHLAACPPCAGEYELHLRLNALPVPAVRADQIVAWRAAALSGAGTGGRRLRARLPVVGMVVVAAAAAAVVVLQQGGSQEQQHASARVQQPPAGSPQSAAGHAGVARVMSGRDSGGDSQGQELTPGGGRNAGLAAIRPQGSFTIFVLPLKIEGDHSLARELGQQYYAGLLSKLRDMPGAELVDAAGRADFRLTVGSSYGKVPERFGGHAQWQINLGIEARSAPDADAYRHVAGFSNNPDCGRISPADLANHWNCTPAGMVESGVQQLRRFVFPPDPASASKLRTRILDASTPQGERRLALAELIEMRQRAPGAMDAELIRVIIEDAIASAPYPAQRMNLWRALRGQSHASMVEPLILASRREADDAVRLEVVSILAADFSDYTEVRNALASIANTDVKMLVRKVAERALSDDAAWLSYVVSTIQDTNLPASQRFEPLAWMAEERGPSPAGRVMEASLHAVAKQLFDNGDAAVLADVLVQAGKGPARPASGLLQITMSSLQHPAVADFLIAIIDTQQDFAAFSLLGRHRANPVIHAKLKQMAASHPDINVRQLAAAQLDAD